MTYTPAQEQTLAPVAREAARQAITHPDRRDVFLCHAWGDREGIARELTDLLVSFGVSVWFSEDDLPLGGNMMRDIEQGLRMSKVGIVLVTPNMLASLRAGRVADRELGVLLRRDRVIPIAHDVTFDDLLDESPFLACRTGLSTEEDDLETIAAKIADQIHPEPATA
ncbi:toll/interleukin-1 receptor domain-containing protein [Actinomyces sp. 594]|nr:toll/interleukin-1 receptor domain-containing protein [Actinomyces sp. 594]